ncbi:TetR/AcrR family transcriptional regulator [Mycobacterium sp. LTG2003]
MASVRRGRGRPAGPGVDVEQRRSDLLDAAERAIRANGPEVGIAEVAGEAGFVRSAVYAVFPNRAAILAALSERQAGRLLAKITKRADGSTDLRRRMELFFDVICQWMQDEPNLYRALDVHEALAGAVEAMLSASLAAGGASTAAAAPWARAIVGSATVTAEWWIRSSSMPRAELVEHLTTLCWDGGAALPFSPFDVDAIDRGQP